MTAEAWLRWTDTFGLPPWTVPLAATILTAAALTGTGLGVRSAWRSHHRALTRAQDAAAPAAVSWLLAHRTVVAVGAAGMAVSMHGLFGFARDVLALPVPLAIGFVAILDGATAALVFLLYGLVKNNPGQWTAQMQETRRGARVMVGLSAAANFYEAPPQSGVVGAIFLALVPIIAAWMTERNLAAHRIAALAGTGQDDHARPGPLRLITIGWHALWARTFAFLGLDANATSGAMARAARARRAADLLDTYRSAVQASKARTLHGRKARAADRRLTELKERATVALDRADVATDPAQALAVAQRMATRTQVPALAVLDWADPTTVIRQLERLAVEPAARRVAAEASVANAEEMRLRAEGERDSALAAAAEAVKAAARAAGDAERAGAERKAEEGRAETARTTADEAQADLERAQAERKRAEEDTALLEERAVAARTAADQAQADLNRALAERERAAGEAESLTNARDRAAEEVKGLRRRADELDKDLLEARSTHQRVHGETAELTGRVQALRQELGDSTRALSEKARVLREAEKRAEDAVRVREAAEDAAEHAVAHRNQLEAAVEVLQGKVRALAPVPDAPAIPLDEWQWGSAPKQAAWVRFLAAVRAGTRLSSTDIFEAMEETNELDGAGKDRVRSWVSEFRRKAAELTSAQVAEQQPALVG